jgi:hypothetical protein
MKIKSILILYIALEVELQSADCQNQIITNIREVQSKLSLNNEIVENDEVTDYIDINSGSIRILKKHRI